MSRLEYPRSRDRDAYDYSTGDKFGGSVFRRVLWLNNTCYSKSV